MRRVAPLFIIFAVAFLTGCSLLTSFEECQSNSDCESGTCEDSICIAQPVTQGCQSHSDCESEAPFCIMQSCTDIIDDCRTFANFEGRNDQIIHIGAALPLSGRNGPKGEATARAALIALEQVNLASGGLDGAKLSLIACDTLNDVDRSVEIARYLQEDLGLSAILGSIASGETLAIAQQVTIDSDVLLISPASTSPAISDLDDNNLVWRTIVSDALQGPAMAWYLEKNNVNRVLVLSVRSAYGQGLLTTFLQDYGTDPERTHRARFQTIDYDVVMAELEGDSLFDSFDEIVSGFQPDAIVIMGSVESQQIIFALDATYFQPLPDEERPIWLLSEAARDPGLLDPVRFESVWPRIVGISVRQADTAAGRDFEVRFRSAGFDLEDHPFADKAYDAAWLLALAYGAHGDFYNATGSDLAAILLRMTEGPEFTPGSSLRDAINSLREGGINFQGASGDLDFDLETGDIRSDIETFLVDDGSFVGGERLLDKDGNRL